MRSGSSLSLVSLEDRKDRYTLRTVLAKHRPEVESDLQCTPKFLSYLVGYKLIESEDVKRYNGEGKSDLNMKNLIDTIVRRSMIVPDSYSKFIDALNRCDQFVLSSLLTSVDKEIEIVDQHQDTLAQQLESIDQFNKKEARRAGLVFGNFEVDDYQQLPSYRADATSFLYKIHQTTRNSLVQFKRCQEIINKLHTDCNEVAKRNVQMMSHLRECEDAVESVASGSFQDRLQNKSSDDRQALVLTSKPESKAGEADGILSSIKKKTSLLDDLIRKVEDDHVATKLVLEGLVSELKKRNGLLTTVTSSGGTCSNALVPVSANENSLQEFLPPIQTIAEELARELLQYMNYEKKMLNQSALEYKGDHRNFDQIDKDLYHLARLVRQKQFSNAGIIANHVIRATKAERQDCMRLVSEIEKLVRIRRKKLPNAATVKPNPSGRLSKYKDSNIWKKLVGLQREIESYTDTEELITKKQKAEIVTSQRRIFQEAQVNSQKIRFLEKKVQSLDNEREKYRRLYQQEKGIKRTNMLRKAVIPSRRPNSLSPVERNTRHLVSVRAKSTFPANTGKQIRVKKMSMLEDVPFLQIKPVRQKNKVKENLSPKLPLASESSFKRH